MHGIVIILVFLVTRSNSAPVNKKDDLSLPLFANSVGDSCVLNPQNPADPVCNPANLTCLVPVGPPPIQIPHGFLHGGHGPVQPTEAPRAVDSPDNSENLAPVSNVGQCVIKKAERGESCGSFVTPSVVCDDGLLCVFDLGYPARNVPGVKYSNSTNLPDDAVQINTSPESGNSTNWQVSKVGACVPILGLNAACDLIPTFIAYPPRCDDGLICQPAIDFVTTTGNACLPIPS